MPATLKDAARNGLRLGEVPGEGRCLLACEDVAAGTVIMVERPVVRQTLREVAKYIESCPSKFSLLRGEENLAATCVSDRRTPYLTEVETNSFMFGGRTIVFHVFSMLNHACATSAEENVCFSILNTGDKPVDDSMEVKLVAVRDIRAGEPLRISYHELFATPSEKNERIKAHCGGNCRCSLCVNKDTERDLGQQHRVFDAAAVCQNCRVASRPVQIGDLVLLEKVPSVAHRGLHGRVVERRDSDASFLVLVHFHGEYLKLWFLSSDLGLIGCGGSNLKICSRCRAVVYCSGECQRAGWKEHKEFCSKDVGVDWETDQQELKKLRSRFQDPTKRQNTELAELKEAFVQAWRHFRIWIQPGRVRHLPVGHQAMQETLYLAIPLGTLALWRGLAEGTLDAELWTRVNNLARHHLQHVRSVVPKFHIAFWTALHHVRGLLSLRSLLPAGTTEQVRRSLDDLDREFRRNLDVADIYDPQAAADFRSNGSTDQVLTEEGSRLFTEMAKDPSRLAEFYKIDPETPLDKKMELMSGLLAGKKDTAHRGVQNCSLSASSATQRKAEGGCGKERSVPAQCRQMPQCEVAEGAENPMHKEASQPPRMVMNEMD